MKSTLYVLCPQCGKNGLLQEIQGKYICAFCNFDYTSLKDNPAKLDEVLLENFKQGIMGQILAHTLYRLVMIVTPQESIQYVNGLARKNNLEVYEPKPSVFSRLFGKKKK